MDLKIDYDVAQEAGKQIAQSGMAYTDVVLSPISGSNTSGYTQANLVTTRMQSLLSGYGAVAARDGERVDLLADYFKEKDEQMKGQISR